MSKPLHTIPNLNDPRFAEFCEFLWDVPLQPAGGLAPGNYEHNFAIIEVPVVPQPGCDTGYCWYNCLDLQHANGGEVVYGWSLWSSKDRFIAQHHAIWRSDEGVYMDPTPNESGTNTILFMPDNFAPFDIEGMRSPPNLEWRHDGSHCWFAGSLVSSTFFITRMEPDEGYGERVNRTRDRYVNR